jgi:choline-sulfatase
MNFYEGSARVPLVIYNPARFAAGRVAAPVTTMDLLPTLVGLANDGDESGVIGPLDGDSLLPMLSGQPPERDTIAAEYLAEGSIAPVVMLRRGDHKFIHSPADPDQLFDLAADPDERHNLAADPAYASLLADFTGEVAARWDLARVDREVRESQRRRIAVMKALGNGVQAPWDFVPVYEASRRYIRNHMDLNDLESRARYPRVEHARPTAV